jgi:hypothetical protein
MGNTSDDSYNFKFEINDWVRRRNFTKQKFENNWTGPYYIVGHGFPGTYKLMRPDRSMVPNLANESHLAAWTARGVEDTRANSKESEVAGENLPNEELDNDWGYEEQDYARQEGKIDISDG